MGLDDIDPDSPLGQVLVTVFEFGNQTSDLINDSVDKAAHVLSSQSWLPAIIKPVPPPPPPPSVAVIAMSRLERVQDWIARHKYITIFIGGVATYVAVQGVLQYKSSRKVRRAKKARNGGREEVVVIAGSPGLPLTKSLSLDMERKGFIVYVVCTAPNDEDLVNTMSRPDIRPLTLDITDPPLAGSAIERFAQHLQSPQSPAADVKPNRLTLTSVLLIPNLSYQTSPIATIPPSAFADLFNTHLLQPILTIQAFLPLLTSRLAPLSEKHTPPKVLVFTPSIISSINPPFHASESMIASALGSFTDVLTAELRPLGIPVTHMQLGTFDFSGFTTSRSALTHHSQSFSGNPQDALVWPDGARQVYGRNFVTQTSSAISGGRIKGLKGSSLRRLHSTVFDIIDGSITRNTVRVGLGASVYGFVGRWVPRSVVSWMMGIRKVDQLSTWKSSSSYDGSSRGESEDGDEGNSGSHEFVAVPPSEHHVWNGDEDSRL